MAASVAACQIDAHLHSGPVAFSPFWQGHLCERHTEMMADPRALVADCSQLQLFQPAGVQLPLALEAAA